MAVNVGKWVGDTIENVTGSRFDVTPGFNLSNRAAGDGGAGTGLTPFYMAKSGTRTPVSKANTTDLGPIRTPGQAFQDFTGSNLQDMADSSGTSGAPTSGTSTSDPYSQWGGQTAYNNLVNDFGRQQDMVRSSARDAAQNQGMMRKSSILDFLDQSRMGQQNLNNQAVNNELGRLQGRQSILDMVGRGIRSGNVTLANRNASDSSAAGAIANAYGQIGSQQNAQLGNEVALANRDLALEQQNFDTSIAGNLRKLEESKSAVANQIVSDAETKLAQIDSLMAQASLPDRIEMEAEKSRIKNQAMQELGQYDAMLQREIAKVNPQGQGQVRAEAAQLNAEGNAAANPFNVGGEAPGISGGGQGQGFTGNLPIFTYGGRREERA